MAEGQNDMRLALALFALLAIAPAVVTAQNSATSFSHGPTLPLYVVAFDDSTKDATASMLTAGAGYSFNFNFAPTYDGRIRRLTLGVPFFVNLPEQGEFNFATGVTIGTFNNMVSVGAAVDLVRTDNDSGALVGNFDRSNVRLLFAFGLNFGGGGDNPAVTRAYKAGETPPATTKQPPPGYVGW